LSERAENELPETVGFVGLGNMGNPMCGRLLERGARVRAYDADAGVLERMRAAGADRAGSPAEAASGVEAGLLSLPNSEVVEEVVLGRNGLVERLSPGATVIDMSSSRPSSTRYLAAELARRGASMLDAPVSGGVARARSGELAVMVGGERELYERYLPLLRVMGERVFHVGAIGAGHLAKALNNLLSATTLAGAAEAVLLGERLGLDPEALIEVVNVSTGRSNSTEVKFPRYILNRAFDAGFSTELYDKDVRTALETAAEESFPIPVGEAVGEVWRRAVEAGYGPEDHTRLYSFVEEMVKGETGGKSR
jgi:3-hydroxyisobutyrate dehydrogenase